jgi:hypothetical protein
MYIELLNIKETCSFNFINRVNRINREVYERTKSAHP